MQNFFQGWVWIGRIKEAYFKEKPTAQLKRQFKTNGPSYHWKFGQVRCLIRKAHQGQWPNIWLENGNFNLYSQFTFDMVIQA